MAKKNDLEVNAIIRSNKDLATSEILYRHREAVEKLAAAETYLSDTQKQMLEIRKTVAACKTQVLAFEQLVESRR